MRVRFQEIDCNEEELLGLRGNGIPARLEHNGSATPPRKAFPLYVLEKGRGTVAVLARPKSLRDAPPGRGSFKYRREPSIAIYINQYMGAASRGWD